MNILLADDEPQLLHFLSRGLQAEGHECTSVNQLHDIIPLVKKMQPQLLILDRLFGHQDSLATLEAIKALPVSPMILMLTALDEVNERVKGLQKGADDYLCKPFDFDELLARISALQRRMVTPEKQSQSVLTFGCLTLKLEERIACIDGIELPLTKIEFELLLYLTENQTKVLSRERILSRVWQTHSDPNTNIVDVYISKLRRKLDENSDLKIQTLRGTGYRLSLN